jgi:hypothetical protein
MEKEHLESEFSKTLQSKPRSQQTLTRKLELERQINALSKQTSKLKYVLKSANFV